MRQNSVVVDLMVFQSPRRHSAGYAGEDAVTENGMSTLQVCGTIAWAGVLDE